MSRKKQRRCSSSKTKSKDIMDTRDTFAMLLIKDFAIAGFPNTNIAQQVNLGYTYAEAMMERRKDRNTVKQFNPVG